MPKIPAAIGMVVLVVLTASGAAIHGRLSNRWGAPSMMWEIGTRVEQIPAEIPGWQLAATLDLPQSAKAMLECSGDIARQYTDSSTGSAVSVTVIVGPPGPTSVHRPEICFPSRDYRQLSERTRFVFQDAEGLEHEFWRVEFQSQELEARSLPVYYAWSTGESWQAPESPRFTYAGQPYLYKIQLVGYPSALGLAAGQDPVPEFLRAFLPAAKTELVSTASASNLASGSP